MKTPIRITLELGDEEWTYLLSLAIRAGYKRTEPRKAWGDAEYKEAIRWYIKSVINKKLKINV